MDLIDIVPKEISDEEIFFEHHCIDIDELELEQGLNNYWMDNYTRAIRYFLSSKMMLLNKNDIVLDIGSGDDGFASIVEKNVKKFYINDIAVKRTFNSISEVREENIFNIDIKTINANKIFLGHAFEHFSGDADIKLIEKLGKEMRIGDRICIEPIFIGKNYLEIVKEGYIGEVAPSVQRIITSESEFPGKVEKNMGFARIYSVDKLYERIYLTASKLGLKMCIYSFKSNGQYLPDMNKYRFKRKTINYPYRIAILEKVK